MPLIVDKDKVRMQILEALQQCIEEKPLDKITLRDIAAKAGMSHAKLLYYFENREDLFKTYVRYTRDFMTERCEAWFKAHDPTDYSSRMEYLNAFMAYVANGQTGENRPNATTQTYLLAHYDAEIAELVHKEFATWRKTMEHCLVEAFGKEMGPDDAEAMMILISGVFICNYNGALTGSINDDIMGQLAHLI